MKTGQNIKALRKQHNLRQVELAEQIGYGAYQQTVSMWESNKATPTFEQAKKMAAIFQVPISEICDEYSLPPKRISREAIEALKRMPWSGNIRELRNVIERLIVLSGDEIRAEDIKLYC